MATEAERSAALDDLITGPQSASNQLGSVNNPTISEVIKGINHQRGETVLDDTNENGGPASGWAALRPARGLPPGGRG